MLVTNINALKAYSLVLRVNVNCSITSSYEFLYLDFSHSRQALLKRFFKGLYQCKAYLSPSYFCLSPNKRRSFVCKGTKNNYLCNYFNNFIKLFHRKRLFADFFFTKETHGNPINKKFHVNDYLLLGDGLFRETNQVFFGLHHSKKRMTLRIVFASVTLLKSVKYGEVYKSKN